MAGPVLVAGAGPAGLVLANALLGAGVDCVLLERQSRAHVEARARAGIITGQTVAALDRLGLAGPLRAAAARRDTCEFRTPESSFVLAYPAAHFVYPQHHLVRDLIEAYTSRGGDIRFGTEVTGLDPGARPAMLLGGGERLAGDLLIDCAGRHGPAGPLFPAVVRHYPYRWRSILVEAPPATPHLTYALHPDGFAGQMPRGPSSTRYYLQEPVTTGPFPALDRRLGVPVPRGPIHDEAQVTMTTTVATRMSHGPVHLAGDSAHTLPPTGAKGLNLAVADATDLADALIARPHDNGARLRGYDQRRLTAAWQAVAFVGYLLALINTPARLAELRDSPGLSAWFTEAYAGTTRRPVVPRVPPVA